MRSRHRGCGEDGGFRPDDDGQQHDGGRDGCDHRGDDGGDDREHHGNDDQHGRRGHGGYDRRNDNDNSNDQRDDGHHRDHHRDDRDHDGNDDHRNHHRDYNHRDHHRDYNHRDHNRDHDHRDHHRDHDHRNHDCDHDCDHDHRLRASGQRNTSAVQYHFGGRDDLLLAILEQYVPVLRARRLELLSIAATDGSDARGAAEAVVRPVTELAQRGWRERAYLQIGSELTTTLDRAPRAVRNVLRQTAGFEAMALLATRCPPLPDEIWAERSRLMYPFIGRAAADRARRLDQRGAKEVLPDDRFVDNLVDMLLGAMTAPVTAHRTARERAS